jgi:predicted ABC-type transport system involved in lysophospholipase L1 biosynthesis ATPase subunit
MQVDHETPELALRYVLRRAGREEVSFAAVSASVHRVQMPDAETKARFVTAVLDARCEEGEALELLGEDVTRLNWAARSRLQGCIGVLTPAVGLISNLNAWENISLPAAYHGAPPIAGVAQTAQEALAALGANPSRLLARLPQDLGEFEKKLVAFVRRLVTRPTLAVFDALAEGLDRDESERAARFADEYRTRHPSGTLILVDL